MSPTLVESIAVLRDRLAEARRSGQRIGLVPTMGALHAGHVRLIEHARHDCASVVVTIFVNPLQFDREDDLIDHIAAQHILQFANLANGVGALQLDRITHAARGVDEKQKLDTELVSRLELPAKGNRFRP